jgi:hypothetical protein
MAFSTLSVLDYLETLVGGLAAVTEVYVGIPTTLEATLCGIVAVAAPALDDAATQLILYTPRFYVGFAYRVAGSAPAQIRAAERSLATALDQFINAVVTDRKLGGTVDDVEFDFSFANNALYQAFSGQEARVFPVSLQVSQQQIVSS